MDGCLFCKIVKKIISSETLYEDKNILAFKDINPISRFHILIIPKKHIKSLNFIEEADRELIAELFFIAVQIVKKNNIKHYKLQINTGEKAGQEIDHLHIHIIAN